MNAAILVDTAWLEEEPQQLRHLTVGMMDEGVRVVQVVPEGVPVAAGGGFATRLSWRESKWSLVNRWRLWGLREGLEEAEVDVVHAVDGRLWRAGLAVADHLDAALVLGLNAREDLGRLPDVLERTRMPGGGGGSRGGEGEERLGLEGRLGLAAATPELFEAAQAVVREVRPGVRTVLCPPGVHCSTVEEADPAAVADPDPERTVGVVVIGNGRVDECYVTLLDALREVIGRRTPRGAKTLGVSSPGVDGEVVGEGNGVGVQLFFKCVGGEQHAVWRACRERGLLPYTSMVPRRLDRLDVLLGAQVLLQPQALERAQTLLLHAFAAGVPVIAHEDAWVDYLLHDQTAWLVNRPRVRDWVEPLERLIREPAAGHELGERARAWVCKHHVASDQLAALLGLYRGVTGESLPFAGA